MKRWVAILLFVFLLALSVIKTNVYAQAPTDTPPPAGGAGGATNAGPEYATCDACGYCVSTNPEGTTGTGAQDNLLIKKQYIIPENWESCRKCLYPDTTNANNADAKETVLINPATGRAPTPAVGHYYTAIGCIATSNFRALGSSSGLVQMLLNVIFGVSGGIAFLYIIYASFIILMSRADPEKLNYGKRLLVGAVVGLIFSISAVFIVQFIGTTILKIPGFGK